MESPRLVHEQLRGVPFWRAVTYVSAEGSGRGKFRSGGARLDLSKGNLRFPLSRLLRHCRPRLSARAFNPNRAKYLACHTVSSSPSIQQK
jgi:hypothetical protein